MAISSAPDPLWSERQELQALQRINHALTATLTLSDVLHPILTEVVSLFTAQSASVILHPQPGEAERVTTYGQGTPFQTFRYPLAGSLASWVAEQQRPLRVARLTPEEWPTVWALAKQLGQEPTPLALLLVPLWVHGQVIGSLEVGWEPEHSITDHEEYSSK